MAQATGNQGTVLIVEDDRNTAALVATYLERDGFTPVVIHDGGQAIRIAADCNPVFVILDIMLPNMDGWEICRALRKESNVPVLMLTAREEELDRVAGLAMGADDYVVKPFSPRELVERVKAILRRSRPVLAAAPATLSFAGLELDAEKHRVTRDGAVCFSDILGIQAVACSDEFPGKVFSREELLSQCYRNTRGGHRPGHRCPYRKTPPEDRETILPGPASF